MKILLYDIDMWHRKGKAMPNLELMKIYNYHYSKGDIIRLLRPQDKIDNYSKVIFFKETDTEIPRALEVYGENKQIYGFGFYNKFFPLDSIYTDVPPSYAIYEPYDEKFKVSCKSHFKKASFVRIENNDFSGYNEKFNYIFVADPKPFRLENLDDFLQEYKTHNIYFSRGLDLDSETKLKFIYPYRDIVKNHLIVNFPITESVVKFYKEKVSYPFSKKYPHETEEDYLLRITSLALYFKASGRKHFYFDLSAAAPEVQKIVRWTIESDERFIDYDPLMYKWVQNQNSELRNLLKSKASSFKPNDIDLKAILKS